MSWQTLDITQEYSARQTSDTNTFASRPVTRTVLVTTGGHNCYDQQRDLGLLTAHISSVNVSLQRAAQNTACANRTVDISFYSRDIDSDRIG